jgi:glycosyltransferase involved in cell wall biosynthesis
VKVGLFIDAAFRRQSTAAGERVWCGEELLGFATFAAAVGTRLDGLVLIARGTDDAAATPYELRPGVELAPLPYYRSLREVGRLLRAMPGTVAALWRALSGVDAVWVSASNPVGLLVMTLATLRRRRILILVRQDTMRYFRSRLPGPLWAPVLLPLWLVDLIYRGMARRARTVVVGAQIAERYRAPRDNVLETTVNLISERDIPAQPQRRAWTAPVQLLTVGRIEPEKNPLLLVEALAQLERERPGGFVATWAGTGRLADEVRSRALAMGVGEALRLPGFVPLGPDLLALYRDADAFVHVSWTEGLPGVLTEALACGLPAIVTDVGGVREAVGDGDAALLVPPGDAGALAAAVLRLEGDPPLRMRLAEAGLGLAREHSLEAEADRVAAFISGG